MNLTFHTGVAFCDGPFGTGENADLEGKMNCVLGRKHTATAYTFTT